MHIRGKNEWKFLAFIFRFPNEKHKRKWMFEFREINIFNSKEKWLSSQNISSFFEPNFTVLYEQYHKFIHNATETSLSPWPFSASEFNNFLSVSPCDTPWLSLSRSHFHHTEKDTHYSKLEGPIVNQSGLSPPCGDCCVWLGKLGLIDKECRNTKTGCKSS